MSHKDRPTDKSMNMPNDKSWVFLVVCALMTCGTKERVVNKAANVPIIKRMSMLYYLREWQRIASKAKHNGH